MQWYRMANSMHETRDVVDKKAVVTARAGVVLDRSPLLCVIDPKQERDSYLAVPLSVSLQ
jgi:hypothetical protein